MRVRTWRVLLLVLLWTSSAKMVHAGNNVWTSIGPDGGIVLALAIDPTTPTTNETPRGADYVLVPRLDEVGNASLLLLPCSGSCIPLTAAQVAQAAYSVSGLGGAG